MSPDVVQWDLLWHSQKTAIAGGTALLIERQPAGTDDFRSTR
jgi:hypothetical protein